MNAAAAAGLLEKIIETKRIEVSNLQDAELHSDMGARGIFKNALRRKPGKPIHVIAECKKASPSMGLLKEDYNPGYISKEYARLGASAISILTDKNYFQGDRSHLPLVKECGLPVIRKDFIISPAQIF